MEAERELAALREADPRLGPADLRRKTARVKRLLGL
jgi:hypothetical protein